MAKNSKQDLYEYQYTTPNKKVIKATLPAVRKPKGRSRQKGKITRGVIMEVIGFFGLWGVPGMLAELAGPAGILKVIFTLLIYGGIFAAGLYQVKQGRTYLNRINRYSRYMKVLEGKPYASISELAAKVAKKKAVVLKDLEFMIDEQWFQEAHLDVASEQFMLTDKAYEQFQLAEKGRQMREQEELEKKLRQIDPVQKELAQFLEEGQKYIKEIHLLNEGIMGEEVSRLLYGIEDVADSIFEQVKRKPDRMPDLRKFMQYYLPMTVKVVNSYKDFENERLLSRQLEESKKEIEETLNKVHEAFIKLREKLFQEDILDISTDLDVLETMMSQEGLLSDELSR